FGGGGGGFGGMGGGSIFGDPGDDPDRTTRMERIYTYADLITQSIDPESWVDVGGETGAIRVINNVFLIRHTVSGHQKIKAFLDMLRQIQPRPLDADAIVLHLRSDKAAELRAEVGEDFPRLRGGIVETLLADTEQEEVLFRATSSGFNGQRFWFSALTQREVLAGVRPVVEKQVHAFAPISGFSTEGLEIIALPLIAPGTDDLTLDIQMAWIPRVQIAPRAVTLASDETVASVDQVTSSMRTVSTAVNLQLGEGIALTIPQQLDDAGRSAGWEDWLILRVRRPGS
ncbi:MAG: hypothetical protein JSV91_05710, partial [Phycisphaerales bacterium]